MDGLQPDTRLFRFMRTDRFLGLLSGAELVLCRPRLWEDPFEDFLSKTTVLDHDGGSIGFNLTRDFFGQCWTLPEECDGLWRNYCQRDDGVRIHTTAEKLLRAIWSHADRFAELRTFVGKVAYMDDSQLRGVLEGCPGYGHWLTDTTGRGIARALLIKRTEFAYENEVRALVSDPDHRDDIKAFPIVPADFIEGVMFAPGMSDSQSALCVEALQALGVAASRISRSTLYDPWKLHFRTAPS